MKMVNKERLDVLNINSRNIRYKRTNYKYIDVEYLQNVDMQYIMQLSQESVKRVRKYEEESLQQGIKNRDPYYINKVLQNVSTYEIFKMLLRKIF